MKSLQETLDEQEDRGDTEARKEEEKKREKIILVQLKANRKVHS